MKNKLARSLEILWIITSVFCLFAAIHQTYYEGFSKSYIFFIFSFVAFIMYLLRRQIRKSKKDNSNV
ncbi:MAG: hypothetical protein K8R31_03165 [Bacteroidales bacterium]|nr:hypothetical protein [Bacteroidales bacterium]